jgi:dihydroneopterin aldolase
MKTLNSNLSIKNYKLPVFLGWSDQERQYEQTVLINVDIYFMHPPKACDSDHLGDTVCYHTLLDLIHDKINTRHFRLIEHLAQTIFRLIEPSLPKQTRLAVTITKQPNIEGLSNGVSFRYGNIT